MSEKHTRTELKPGLFFSPGFFMNFWHQTVFKQFSKDIIEKHQKFKRHKEIWLGAIIAAAQFKATGVKHYVGLPETEPPDTEVVRFVSTKRSQAGLQRNWNG